jgi:hypothetical protein
VYISLVILLLLTPLSAFPVTNAEDQQLVDGLNKKTPILSSSHSISNDNNTNIQTKEDKHILVNTYNGPASSNNNANVKNVNLIVTSSETPPWYTTTGHSGSGSKDPWWMYLVVAIILLVVACCTCICRDSKARTGRWVPGWVWSEA